MKEYKYKINGIKFNVSVGDLHDNNVTVEVNGTPYSVEIVKDQSSTMIKPKKTPSAAPRSETGEKVIAKPVVASVANAVKAPLPGTVSSFTVKVGDTVTAGQTVCMLEAMKMENDIHCTSAGTVKQILVNVGDAVQEGADLMIIE